MANIKIAYNNDLTLINILIKQETVLTTKDIYTTLIKLSEQFKQEPNLDGNQNNLLSESDEDKYCGAI